MEQRTKTQNPVSDLLFDWVSVLHNKAEGVAAYERYLADAHNRNAGCCIELLEKLRDQDVAQLHEIKTHVARMLERQDDLHTSGQKKTFKQTREQPDVPRH